MSHRVKCGFDDGCYSLFSEMSFDIEFKCKLRERVRGCVRACGG
jgi:hypothetical protein